MRSCSILVRKRLPRYFVRCAMAEAYQTPDPHQRKTLGRRSPCKIPTISPLRRRPFWRNSHHYFLDTPDTADAADAAAVVTIPSEIWDARWPLSPSWWVLFGESSCLHQYRCFCPIRVRVHALPDQTGWHSNHIFLALMTAQLWAYLDPLQVCTGYSPKALDSSRLANLDRSWRSAKRIPWVTKHLRRTCSTAVLLPSRNPFLHAFCYRVCSHVAIRGTQKSGEERSMRMVFVVVGRCAILRLRRVWVEVWFREKENRTTGFEAPLYNLRRVLLEC